MEKPPELRRMDMDGSDDLESSPNSPGGPDEEDDERSNQQKITDHGKHKNDISELTDTRNVWRPMGMERDGSNDPGSSPNNLEGPSIDEEESSVESRLTDHGKHEENISGLTTRYGKLETIHEEWNRSDDPGSRPNRLEESSTDEEDENEEQWLPDHEKHRSNISRLSPKRNHQQRAMALTDKWTNQKTARPCR